MNKTTKILISCYNKGYRVGVDGKLFNPKGREIFGYINSNGYRKTTIRINDKFCGLYFHRLQAFQKYGINLFNDGMEVRHLDGNALNNSYDNIAIGTHSENMQDIPAEIRLKKSIIATSNRSVFHDHESIINDRNKGMKYSDIMTKYGIKSKGTISFIINSSIKSKSTKQN